MSVSITKTTELFPISDFCLILLARLVLYGDGDVMPFAWKGNGVQKSRVIGFME